MYLINWPFVRAKVDQQVSWWSGGQTCYQVPLNILDKLVSFSEGIFTLGTHPHF